MSPRPAAAGGCGSSPPACPSLSSYGIGSWLFTKYAIVGGDLRIETGLLFKRSRVVDLDRLESVDVVQPLVPRLLGLAEVRLEVAGGSSTEAPLAYLAVADARELKARLLALRVGVPTREVQPEEKLLVRVPVERLVIAALLSGAWLASVVAGGLLVLDMVLGGGAVIGLFLPAVFGAVRGVRNFLADFDFTVAESTDGLHITRGLIDTRSQTLAEGRIQAVRITRPLLWRPFGWVKVSVNVAGYAPRSDGQIATTSTLLPVAPRAEADWLLRRVVPGLDIDLSRLSLAPAPRRRPVDLADHLYGLGDRSHRTICVRPGGVDGPRSLGHASIQTAESAADSGAVAAQAPAGHRPH